MFLHIPYTGGSSCGVARAREGNTRSEAYVCESLLSVSHMGQSTIQIIYHVDPNLSLWGVVQDLYCTAKSKDNVCYVERVA